MNNYSEYVVNIDPEDADRIATQALYECLYFQTMFEETADKELVLAVGVVLNYLTGRNTLPEDINVVLKKYGSPYVNEEPTTVGESPFKDMYLHGTAVWQGSSDGITWKQIDLEDFLKDQKG
jgi:hypothetical protein